MRKADCAAFLKWALPRLGLRWAGYRRVHRTVCKRLARRLRVLGLPDVEAYRAHLEAQPAEWAELEALCRIPLSRFWRDSAVFEALGRRVLPGLAAAAAARGGAAVRAWSAGCASGEEPYSLLLAWRFLAQPAAGGIDLTVLATDADPHMLARARSACYGPSALNELPGAWLHRAFARRDGLYCLRPELREAVTFARQDLRRAMPEGRFDIVLCRNLAFTYFEAAWQRRVLEGLRRRIAPGGVLVIGDKERLPVEARDFRALRAELPIYRLPRQPEQAVRGTPCEQQKQP